MAETDSDWTVRCRAVAAEHPSWGLDADAWIAELSQAWPDGVPTLQWTDLGLARACGRGSAPAIAELLSRHEGVMRAEAHKVKAAAEFVAEATARLRERLLAPRPDGPPRIATYQGRGSLGDWLRVAAARNALNLAQGRGEQVRARTDPLGDLVGDDHPELRWLAERYAEAVNDAVRDAFATLDKDDRALLRMHYVDGIGLAELGALHSVHKSTMSRRISRARDAVLEATCAALSERLGGDGSGVGSLVQLVRSRIDVTLSRVLGPRTEG